MKSLITIGLPSKGRLREGAIQFFEKNNFKLTSNGGDRNYFAKFENYPNIKIIYFHKGLILCMNFSILKAILIMTYQLNLLNSSLIIK